MPKPHPHPQSDSRAQIRRFRQTEPPIKWREIAQHYPGVPLGTLARYAYDPTYEPRRLDYRRSLGLPAYPPVKISAHPCGVCGEVHIKEVKRCPTLRAPARPRRVRYSETAVSALVQAYQAAVIGVLFGGANNG